MKKDNLVFVLHIRDSINKILQYTKNISHDEFKNNTMIQDAVIRQIEIIGEASKNLPEEFRNQYEDIPWKRMIGMRNKVIHEYFGVRLNIVWDAVKDEIPSLKILIDNIISKLTPKSPLGL